MRTHHLGEVLGPGFTPESSQDTVCGGGVRLVMTEVVNLHRGLVKMGFQGVVFVGELGEIKRLGMGLGQTQETSAKRFPRNPRDRLGRRNGSKDTTVLTHALLWRRFTVWQAVVCDCWMHIPSWLLRPVDQGLFFASDRKDGEEPIRRKQMCKMEGVFGKI